MRRPRLDDQQRRLPVQPGGSEDLQRFRTGNQPNAYTAFRNLVCGAFRRAGAANIARARRYYGRDDQRILAFYGYT